MECPRLAGREGGLECRLEKAGAKHMRTVCTYLSRRSGVQVNAHETATFPLQKRPHASSPYVSNDYLHVQLRHTGSKLIQDAPPSRIPISRYTLTSKRTDGAPLFPHDLEAYTCKHEARRWPLKIKQSDTDMTSANKGFEGGRKRMVNGVRVHSLSLLFYRPCLGE